VDSREQGAMNRGKARGRAIGRAIGEAISDAGIIFDTKVV